MKSRKGKTGRIVVGVLIVYTLACLLLLLWIYANPMGKTESGDDGAATIFPAQIPVSNSDSPLLPEQIRVLKQEVRFLLGVQELYDVPIDRRSALNATETGRLPFDGYTLIKLYFESLPEFYVTANLYVPDDPEKYPRPRPAVICPHGHWGQGKANPIVVERAIGLVKQGYVVLTYDGIGAGEREAYDSGHGFYPIRSANSGGPLMMGLQVYEISRAVDLLAQMADLADVSRLAVTGGSGGAAQTIYAAMLDPRIDLIVPVSFGSMINENPLGCGCESIPFLGERFAPHLFSLVFPAKALFINEYELDTILAARDLYARLGQPDRFRFSVVPEHRYGRQARTQMYAWLSRWLLDSERGERLSEPPGVFDGMPLPNSDELAVGIPDKGETFATLSARYRNGLPKGARPRILKEWNKKKVAIRSGVRTLLSLPENPVPPEVKQSNANQNPELIELLPEALPMPVPPIDNGEVLELDDSIEAVLIKPDTAAPWPCVVMVNPEQYPEQDPEYEAIGRPEDETTRVSALLEAGYAVLMTTPRFSKIPEPPAAFRLVGDKGVNPRQAIQTGVVRTLDWRGTPLFGKQVADLSSALTYLAGRDDMSDLVTIWGIGYGGLWAIAAAALDDRFCQVVVDRSVVRFSAERTDRRPAWANPPRFLTVAEFDPLASLVAPRPLIVAAPVVDSGEPIDLEDLQSRLAWTREAYRFRDASKRLKMMVVGDPDKIVEALDPQCF